jgi:hypothetical protein
MRALLRWIGVSHARAVCAGVLLLYASPASATLNELDLGPPSPTGGAAFAARRFRQVAVVRALACHDELNFLAGINEGEDTGDWPIAHLSAKAAVLTAEYDDGFGDNREDAGRSCLAHEGDTNIEKWRRLFFDGDKERFEGASQEWNAINAAEPVAAKVARLGTALDALYARRFGDACRTVIAPGTPTLAFGLSRQCLMLQIAEVMGNKWHGAWKIKKVGDTRTRIPKVPGTDGLICPTDWALINNGLAPADWTFPWDELKGVEGDGDMGVIEYTRLTHLLYGAKARNPDLRADADRALNKLNQWLLTLRGEPARETYNVFWDCGNRDNSFGTADDYLDDNDVYNKELDETVSGDDDGEDSFLKMLWKVLRFLVVLVAVALAVGLIAGALLGAGLGVSVGIAVVIVGAGIALIALATLLNVSIEETENHLLMQNSSKYLKNKLMMAEEREAGYRVGFDELVDQNEDVQEWLLDRLERIVDEDFLEYNSKPYNRLSLKSLLNLIDYSCDITWTWERSLNPPRGTRPCHPRDEAIVTAASAVYDLAVAKAALGSSQGRRLIPFRRLAEENTRYRDTWRFRNGEGVVSLEEPKRFLDIALGADHLLAALQFWVGTTHHGPNRQASSGSVHEMLWYATSRYRPHEMILDIAVNKSTPYEQSFKHDTRERYSSGPGWLLTAGGDDEAQPQGLRFSIVLIGWPSFSWKFLAPTNDKGVGVPTTLMAAGEVARRDTYGDFLRFEGKKEDWGTSDLSVLQSFSNNGCVAGSFACGIRFEIPDSIRGCMRDHPSPAFGQLQFISSVDCPEYRDGDESTANDFFVAVFHATCERGQDVCKSKEWGFIEVAQAERFGGSWTAYADAVVAANLNHFRTWQRGEVDEEMAFWSVTQNREIQFTPEDEDFDEDCRACGSVVRHVSGSRFTIHNPNRPKGHILIDLNDEEHPIRQGEGGVVLDKP